MRKLPIGIQTNLHRFGKRSLIPYQSDRRDIVKVCMEFAEEQNITIANTKVRIMRAKKLLAELLKNKEFED